MEIGELYKVSAQEARVQLSDLINKAIYGQQPSLITRQGKPAAVLISFAQWQAFQLAQSPAPLPSQDGSSSTQEIKPLVQEPGSEVDHQPESEQRAD